MHHRGGVFILVRYTITSTEVVEIESKAEEIWVKISIKGSRDFYVCCHYRSSVTNKTYVIVKCNTNRTMQINKKETPIPVVWLKTELSEFANGNSGELRNSRLMTRRAVLREL